MAATRSSRSLVKMTRSISASIAGFLMPIRLREPGWSAACEPQKPRCSLPGDSDWPQDATMMSKSHCRSRFSYCAVSTTRTRHGDAKAFERRLVEQHEALGRRVLDQKFDGKRLAGLGVDQLGVLDLVAGLAKQPRAPRADCRALACGLPPTGLL